MTPLRELPGKLDALQAHLGLDASAFTADEQLTHLYVNVDAALDHVDSAAAELAELGSSFGAALKGRVECLGAPLDLGPGLTVGEVRAFAARVVSTTPDVLAAARRAQVGFEVDKERLLADRLAWPDGVRPLLFLYPSTLVGLVERPTQDFEACLWPDGTDVHGDKLIVIVPAWEGFFGTQCLAVVGGDFLVQWDQVATRDGATCDRHRNFYSGRRRHLKWEKPWTRDLTPLCFQPSPATSRPDPDEAAVEGVVRSFQVHAANLSLLFTADSTFAVAGEPVSTFQGARGKSDVAWGVPAGRAAGAIRQGAVQALVDVAAWPDLAAVGRDTGSAEPLYAEDRLSFVQNAVVSTLAAASQSPPFATLLDRASWLSADIRAQWKLFIEGRVEHFRAEIRELEDYVSGTVQAFSDRTAEMIKGLSESMLAAVAVVVGSFVAALLQDKADPAVLRFGVALYLGYLLLFPLVFGMAERLSSFLALARQFEARRARFRERLYDELVERLVGAGVRQAKRRFAIAFTFTLVAYIAVAAILGWQFLLQPVSQWPVHLPGPRVTAAP